MLDSWHHGQQLVQDVQSIMVDPKAETVNCTTKLLLEIAIIAFEGELFTFGDNEIFTNWVLLIYF